MYCDSLTLMNGLCPYCKISNYFSFQRFFDHGIIPLMTELQVLKAGLAQLPRSLYGLPLGFIRSQLRRPFHGQALLRQLF